MGFLLSALQRVLFMIAIGLCSLIFVNGGQPVTQEVASYPDGVDALSRIRFNDVSKTIIALTLTKERIVKFPPNGTASFIQVPPVKNELVGLCTSSKANTAYAMIQNDTTVFLDIKTMNYTKPFPVAFATEVFALELSGDESELFALRDGFLDKVSIGAGGVPINVVKGGTLGFSFDMRRAPPGPIPGLLIARGGALIFLDLQTSKLRQLGYPDERLNQPWSMAVHPVQPMVYVVTSDQELLGVAFDIAGGNTTVYTYAQQTPFSWTSIDISGDGEWLYVTSDAEKKIYRLKVDTLSPIPIALPSPNSSPIPAQSPSVSPSPGTSPTPAPNGTSPTPSTSPSGSPTASWSPEPFSPAKESWFQRQRGLAIALIVCGSGLLVGIATLVMWRISRLPREPARGPLLHQQPEAVSYEGF